MAQQDLSIAGNLRIVGSTTVLGQVSIGSSSLNLGTFASDMVGNITAANAAIVSANSAMKNYVDTGLASALFIAGSYGNVVVASYLPLDTTIIGIRSNIAAANINISNLNSIANSSNANILSLQSNVIAANANISATYSNVRAIQSNINYITGNILANGDVFASNVTVGNINASGNLIMTGTDDTTIRFVRAPDNNVLGGDIYGNIDYVADTQGVSGRISVMADSNTASSQLRVYTRYSSITPLSLALTANTGGLFGATMGHMQSWAPNLRTGTRTYEPVANDNSSIGGSYIPGFSTVTSQWTNWMGTPATTFLDMTIAHRFLQLYGGFAGGDRANIDITAFHNGLSSLDYGAQRALASTDNQMSDVEFHVQGVYVENPDVNPRAVKRIRKRWIASITYSSSTGNWTVLDQQLLEPVYNSDAANWPAGAVNSGRAFLQANVTPGSQSLVLRLEAPTGHAATSHIHWQITTKIRTIDYL